MGINADCTSGAIVAAFSCRSVNCVVSAGANAMDKKKLARAFNELSLEGVACDEASAKAGHNVYDVLKTLGGG
jgi:hypothetical protein